MKLCPKCFKEYKRSKEGKQQRLLKLRGLPNAYGAGRWPVRLYHDGSSALCRTHLAAQNRELSKVYGDRDILCKSLGFTSYDDYLSSDLWRSIRTKKFAESGGICFLCGGNADAVHHGSYDLSTLRGDTFEHLHAICNICHGKIEFYRGYKTLPDQSMRLARYALSQKKR